MGIMQHARRAWSAWACVLCALGGCSLDAPVLRSERLDDTAERADAGLGSGGSFASRALGCRSLGVAGAGALVASILQETRESTGEWLQLAAGCDTDADCRKTLFAPVCDTALSTCTACPDRAQQLALSANIGACLASFVERCCSQPVESASDCVFRECVMSCGAQ